MPSTNQKTDTPRVNLRHERERHDLTIKDIHIRVGIPLEHIEALESGVVPQALRGKKLLRSKQAYLSFLGFPKHSKLDVRRRRIQTKRGSRAHRERTGSTEILVPTTSKSIFTGFGLAVAMVLGLKTISMALDNPAFSLESILDSIVDELNESATPTQAEHTSSSVAKDDTLLASTTSRIPLEKTSSSLHSNIGGLVQDLVDINEIEEPTGPTGPNEISIRVQEQSRLFFVCDGHLIHKGKITRGNNFTCNFTQKAIVDIHDPASARITHNDKLVRPMGPQGDTRRLSFVHNNY